MRQKTVASHRISTEFMALLEQQFLIDHPIRLRYPSQFADHLSIHVNHLNRSIKQTVNKTTTQIIAERIVQEAKFLLRNGDCTVSDIAFSLGFTEVTHFSNFFRKHTKLAPTAFRYTLI